MAFFYCKSGGTATGDGGRYASAKVATDNWATAFSATSEYYAGTEEAWNATTPPAAGDYVLVSDASSYTSGSSINTASSTDEGVHIVCVDDDNVGQVAVATAVLEQTTGGADIGISGSTVDGVLSLYGMWYASNDNISLCEATGQHLVCTNCTFDVEDALSSVVDGARITFHNVDIIFDDSGSSLSLSNGCHLDWFGGVWSINNTIPSAAFNGGGINGGFSYHLIGVDMSDFSNDLCSSDSSTSDGFLIRLEQCRLNAGISIPGGTLGADQRVEMAGCSFGTTDTSEYQYGVYQGSNKVEEATNIYRDGSIATPGGTRFSYKVDTGADNSKFNPFTFDIPSRFAELSTASEDVITLNILSSATLYDDDVWLVACYPDSTNSYIPRFLSGFPATEIGTSTTELTTNTEAWTGRTSENRYEIELDTSALAGADSMPALQVCVGKTSASFYICSTPELS